MLYNILGHNEDVFLQSAKNQACFFKSKVIPLRPQKCKPAKKADVQQKS